MSTYLFIVDLSVKRFDSVHPPTSPSFILERVTDAIEQWGLWFSKSM